MASNSSAPLISVVIPTYNRGPQIQSTIDSVLQQTQAPEQVEVIVVDDGSTDETGTWVEQHYAIESRVRVVLQQNTGVAGARNRGLTEARGEFIAYLDHDDYWLPEKLEKQLAVLQKNPAIGVVYCLWQQIEADGRVIPGHDIRVVESSWSMPEGRVLKALIKRNFIISMSVPLMRTELTRCVGGFDSHTVPSDDRDLWMRLAKVCEFAYVRDVLVHYRHHDAQQSRDEMRMWRAELRVFRKHWKSAWNNPKALWNIAAYGYFLKTVHPFYDQARTAIAHADWKMVRSAFFRCWRRYPLAVLTLQWLYVLKRLVTKDARPF